MSNVAMNVWKKAIASKLLPVTKTITDRYSGEAFEVEIKQDLSLQDCVSLVRSSVNSCFDDQHKYIPYLVRAAFDVSLISYFTNIALGKDHDKVYELARRTNIIDAIEETVGHDFVLTLWSEVQAYISARREENSGSYKIAKFCDALTDFALSAKDVFEDITQTSNDPQTGAEVPVGKNLETLR